MAKRTVRATVVAALVSMVASLMVAVAPAAHAVPKPPPPGKNAHGFITATIDNMTLEQKVGQLFSTHVYGNTVDSSDPGNIKEFGLATPREIITKYHLGGVLYFAWTHSVDNPKQAATLSNGIQQVATTTGAKIPMLMSIDQEGGLVTRMLEPATQTPGAMAIGATRDARGARDLAAIQGKELAAVGVRQNFAPVADVNVNPDNPVIGVRSFSSDPALASTMTAAQVHGYESDAKISSAVKHFPGHGDTAVDSHYGFPTITHTRAEWDALDRPPFDAAIDAGVDVIMTAHIQVPALDASGDPATLSKPIITDLLRGEMGYRGVVVTDSLGMQGVRDKYGDDRVPVLALKAGVDILLNPPNLDVAYNGVLDAVRSGELSQKRINESLYRIIALKLKNGTYYNTFVDVDAVDAVVGIPQHLQRVQAVTDASTTVLRNTEGALPMKVDGKKIVVTGYGATSKVTVASALSAGGATASVSASGTNPTAAEIAAAVTAAGSADAVVVLTMNAASYAGQVNLVKALQATGKPVIVAAVRNPYDISQFPDVSTYLATYSYGAVALRSLVSVITGAVAPKGKLPVAIPAADGSELFEFGSGETW